MRASPVKKAANRKVERKRRSRAAILGSAGRLLRERGIRASSVQDVMQGAGLTVGGFYGHFDSKEELFTETLASESSRLWNALLESAQGDSPRERGVNVIARYLSRGHRDAPIDGCLLPSVVAEVAQAGEPYRSALERELAGFARSFASLLGGGPEARDEALSAIALMFGALSLSRAVAGTPLGDELLRVAKKLGPRMLAERGG